MSDPVVESLILQLLEWLAKGNRSYQETMEAWRTSCPRLPVWEDAMDRGLICFELAQGISVVRATPAGLSLLEQHLPSKIQRSPETPYPAIGLRRVCGL
jgi:hypothetical protein